MRKEENLGVLEKIVTETCSHAKVALYDFEIKATKKGKVVLVSITKIGGPTIDDCVNVSRLLENKLDETDFFSGKYYLEVTSPGLERNLTQKKHYVSAINEKVRITYKNGEKVSTIDGILQEVYPDYIKVSRVNEEIKIPLKDIKKAKTVFEFTKKEK